jgi:hypothetical protein
MFSNPNRKKFLLLAGVLALVLANPLSAMAKNGLWWYVAGSKTVVTLTLVNLTDYYLTTTYVDVTNGGNYCFAYPFVRFGVKVPPYRTASWKCYSPGNPSYMNGKMTFWAGSCEGEPDCQELDQKWSFDLNFHSEKAGGLNIVYPESGTWIYLTATHTDNIGDYGWIPSWDPTYYPDAYLFEGYLGYATRLNDGHMHNQMNLEGYEVAVSLFSGGNNDIVMVVQQTHGKPGIQPPDEYVGWMLNWVDNDSDSVP